MLAFLLAVPVAYAGNIFILTENVIPENTELPESHINDVSWDKETLRLQKWNREK